jgi:hypothetical protein
MANDFMRNANKVSLDGEVVSFSNTLPIVDVKEDVVKTPIVEEPKKEEKVEEIVVDTNDEEDVVETEDEEITESAEETTEESDEE